MKLPKAKDILFVNIQLLLFVSYLIPIIDFTFSIFIVLKYFSLFISLLGIFTIILAMIQLNKNLTPFPTPKQEGKLIQTGLYKVVRHPIYSGIILFTIAYGIYQASGWKIGIGVLLWILFHFKSRYEEMLLSKQFDEYKTYITKTNRFFPFFKWNMEKG